MGPALEPTVLALKAVVREDKNAICVGFAVDAPNRLGSPASEKRKDLATSPRVASPSSGDPGPITRASLGIPAPGRSPWKELTSL